MLTATTAPLNKSLLLRVARDIHANVSACALVPAAAMCLPDYHLEKLQIHRRMADKARRHGLMAASHIMERWVLTTAQSLIRDLHDACAGHEWNLSRGTRCNSMQDIYRDLLYVEDEFDEVRIDRDDHTLTVRTEPIELKDVQLGPFDIVLDWRKLPDDNPYRVIAVRPVHCVADNSVTHPHVKGNDLCEGDGHASISSALHRGELFEFFVLVRQILRNFNPGSAYQQMAEWFESDCSGCGCCPDEYERNT